MPYQDNHIFLFLPQEWQDGVRILLFIDAEETTGKDFVIENKSNQSHT